MALRDVLESAQEFGGRLEAESVGYIGGQNLIKLFSNFVGGGGDLAYDRS